MAGAGASSGAGGAAGGVSPPLSPALGPADGADAEEALEEADHLAMLEAQRTRIIAAQKRAAEGLSTVEEAPAVAAGTCVFPCRWYVLRV